MKTKLYGWSLALGSVVIVLVLAVAVALRLPGAIITVAALGLPLLLVICWLRAGVLRALPRWAVLTTVVLSIGLAAAWVVLTGDLITTMTDSAFDEGTAGRRVLRDGLGIAEGGSLLMLVPTVVVRVLWRTPRQVHDGFVIGGLAALLFTGTATLTRLAPQLAATPVGHHRPVHWLLMEAAVRGVTVPLTAACAGGLIGAALWSDRRARNPRPATFAVIVVCGIAVLGAYAVTGWADVEGIPQSAILAWHVGLAVIAFIALRISLRLTIRDEGNHPEAVPSDEGAGRQRLSPIPVIATWLVTMVTLSAIAIVVPAQTVTPPPRYNCPPDCGSPPQGRPVSVNPRFTTADRSYSVAYPAPGSAYDVRVDGNGVTATSTWGDRGTMRLTSEPAAGRTPQEVARSFVARSFPIATTAFEIPNAMVGFEPGYGEVADIFPLKLDNSSRRLRSVVVVAIKNDLALIAAAIGPYHEFGPNFGPGRPSPTNLQIAEDLGRYVNSFRWRGDPLG